MDAKEILRFFFLFKQTNVVSIVFEFIWGEKNLALISFIQLYRQHFKANVALIGYESFFISICMKSNIIDIPIPSCVDIICITSFMYDELHSSIGLNS